MKAREIPQLLQYFGLPSDSVAIGGIGYDRWYIAEAEEGKWEVYYFDRGEKIKHYLLPDETAACMYLLGNLALAQVMKRRLIPA